MAISLCMFTVNFLLITVSQISAAIVITPDIDPPRRYLTPGERIILKCTTDKPDRQVRWEWLDARDNTTMDALRVPGVSAVQAGSIKIDNVSGNVGGNYTCTDGHESSSFWLNVLDASSLIPLDVTTNGTDDSVLLRCLQRVDPAHRLPLIWTTVNKNSTSPERDLILNEVAAMGDDSYKVLGAEQGYALKIKNKDRKRYPEKNGQYFCKFNVTGTDAETASARSRSSAPLLQTVRYASGPDVRIEGVSQANTKSATKDEPGTLTCVYNSFSERTYVVWSYRNDSAVGNETQIIVNQPYDDLNDCPAGANAGKKCAGDYVISRSETLENESRNAGQFERTSIINFPNVQDSNAGRYFCTVFEYDVQSKQTRENKAEVQLKVKDKLAALWPFLGIVAEVVILCAIIFIYEKRRNKTVEDEDESEPMKGSVHETTETVVRSRKA